MWLLDVCTGTCGYSFGCNLHTEYIHICKNSYMYIFIYIYTHIVCGVWKMLDYTSRRMFGSFLVRFPPQFPLSAILHLLVARRSTQSITKPGAVNWTLFFDSHPPNIQSLSYSYPLNVFIKRLVYSEILKELSLDPLSDPCVVHQNIKTSFPSANSASYVGITCLMKN